MDQVPQIPRAQRVSSISRGAPRALPVLLALVLVVGALLGRTMAWGAPAKPVRRVYVGVYLADVSGFDINNGRFQADLHLWCKWLGGQEVPQIVLANGEVERREVSAREADGEWRSVRWRIQGTFRGTFPLHRFPFDAQQLAIQFDLPADEGVLVPDLAGSGMSPQFSITGWLYERSFRAEPGTTVYRSDLGSIEREGQTQRASSVRFVLDLRRPVLAYVVKFMVPLAIILITAIIAFFIPANQLEVRATISITALLAVVAFQFSQAESLPDVSYLMTVDKIFLGAYVLVMLNMLETVVAFRLHDARPRLSRQLDRAGAMALPIAGILGAVLLAGGAMSAEKREPAASPSRDAPAPRSARSELVMSRAAVKELVNWGLLYRGLAYEVDGELRPHLVEAVPRLTNRYVRLLDHGGMAVRWRLRPDIRWSDGSPITADDVAYSARLGDSPDRRRVEVLDERTVEVEYAHRTYQRLEPFIVLPRRHIEAVYRRGGLAALYRMLRERAVPGDGPYQLAEFSQGKHILYRRNPHFAGARPALERIRLIADPRTVAEELTSGLSHVAWHIGPQSYAALRAWPRGRTRSDPANWLYFLQPDLRVAPYDDVRVRQAILHGIDRRRAGRKLFDDDAQVAHSYRPPSAPDYARDVTPYAYDPQRARALLRSAGLPLPLPITILARRMEAGAPEREMLEDIVAQLDTAGFRAELRWLPGRASDAFMAGGHGALLYHSRRGDEPAPYWNIPYRDGRYQSDAPTRLFDRDIVALHERFTRSLFFERRVAQSGQLQRAWAKRLPLLPLIHGVVRSAHVAELAGWDPLRGGKIWWNVESWHFRK